MKTTITLVRHAETKANQKRSFSGRREVLLSEYGYQQINDLTRVLLKNKYDAVYSSPMTRALETVKPVVNHENIEFHLLDDLLELSYGELEGTPRDEISVKFPEVWDFFQTYDYFIGVKGQEDIEVGASRLYNCLISLCQKHKGGHILVATHGMIMRAFFCLVEQIPWSSFAETKRIKNTAINLLEYDDETNLFKILVYNDTTHEEII